MRIGFVSKFLPEKDGGAIYANHLCDNLPCEVVRIGDIESEADYNVNLRSLSLGKELAKIIEKEKLDLIHVQYVPAGQYFGKYTINMSLVRAMKQKVPVILTFAEVHTKMSNIREIVLQLLQKVLAGRAGAVITHAPDQAAFLSKYNKHSHHVHMGLIPRPIKPRKDKNVLFFGMLGPGKGVEHLIKAMDELPEYNLRVAGSITHKPYEQVLKTAIEKSTNKKIIADFSWIVEETKNNYYDRSDIVVLPYVWSPSQSGVLHDALSYGKPSVVSDLGAIGEIVKEYETGVAIEPGKPAAIAEGIKKAFKHYEQYQQGIKNYQEQANWESIGKKHMTVYEEVLDERS